MERIEAAERAVVIIRARVTNEETRRNRIEAEGAGERAVDFIRARVERVEQERINLLMQELSFWYQLGCWWVYQLFVALVGWFAGWCFFLCVVAITFSCLSRD